MLSNRLEECHRDTECHKTVFDSQPINRAEESLKLGEKNLKMSKWFTRMPMQNSIL